MASDLTTTNPQTRSLSAHCFCKAVHFSLTVPVSALPLRVHLCHCNVCRTTQGSFCCFHAPLPAGVVPQFIAPSTLASSMTGYSHALAASARYFCKTCGCHVGDADLEASDPKTGLPRWCVASSIFPAGVHDEGSPDQFFRIDTHVMPGSGPSGLHEWLPRIGDRTLATWAPGPSDLANFPLANEPYQPTEAEHDPTTGAEVLRVACHCEGVRFTIGRPDKQGRDAKDSDGKPTLASEYVSPDHADRWVACLDACDDCRLHNGTHLVGWAFVPLSKTSPRIPDSLEFGTMARYESSPGVVRTFCSVCGATFFFTCKDRTGADDMVVDLAIGTIRAPEGVTAHRWLDWRTGRMAWHDSGKGYDGAFAEALAEGHAAWGKKTYGEAYTWKIAP